MLIFCTYTYVSVYESRKWLEKKTAIVGIYVYLCTGLEGLVDYKVSPLNFVYCSLNLNTKLK